MFQNTLQRVLALAPDTVTVHTLAEKRASRLKEENENYHYENAVHVGEMVREARRVLTEAGYRPYYMYRQKYMSGNLENVGYAKPDKVCMYNIDMMEETTSIMAHGAGAMTKRIFDGECRVERIPNPKDVNTYIAKVHTVDGEKRELYSK